MKIYFGNKKFKKNPQLLVSYIKPHGPISRDTLARWTLRILKEAGVDTSSYAAHSTGGAMVSKARLLGISVRSILAHAGWKTQRAFARHYDKRVVKKSVIAETLLAN
jgi:predicted transcriptional regulator